MSDTPSECGRAPVARKDGNKRQSRSRRSFCLFFRPGVVAVTAPHGRLLQSGLCTCIGHCIVTCAVATVDGFGWLLLAMGAAQCRLEQRRTRLGYVAMFVLILLYREIPWADSVFLPLLE